MKISNLSNKKKKKNMDHCKNILRNNYCLCMKDE